MSNTRTAITKGAKAIVMGPVNSTSTPADFPHPALGQDLTLSIACDAIGDF
jgi:hypothetical protein